MACIDNKDAVPSNEVEECVVCQAQKAHALVRPPHRWLISRRPCTLTTGGELHRYSTSHIAIVSPVSPPGKQAVAIKIYHLSQATKNNLLPRLSIWAVSCGCRVWVFLAWYRPLERTFLSRIHELFCLFENSQENIPIAYRGSWVPPCSTYYTPRRRL